MNENVMVSVLIATYNHEKYIRKALEGALTQRTNFKYEVIVHDDASTDHTADIVRKYEQKYPDKMRTIFQKENQFGKCHISSKYLYPQIRGKYFALLDGDDYWINPNKLQIQVDFLESHSDYSMCIHNAYRLNNETGKLQLLNTFPADGTYLQEQQILTGLGTNFPACSSYVMRTGLLWKMPDFFCQSNVMDYPLRQYYASMGKVYYYAKPMSVYRVSISGSYMKMVADDQSFYNNYTLEMIRFFEEFDRYTEKKYHEILKRKIDSDYYGYCTSIEQNEGIKKAHEKGLDIERVTQYYKKISFSYVSEDIIKLQERSSKVYIYGTSRLAMICKKQLDAAQIPFDGYVVSDGQMKINSIEDKNVYYLSEVVCGPKESTGFILAIQPVNIDSIKQELDKFRITNYCEPYVM